MTEADLWDFIHKSGELILPGVRFAENNVYCQLAVLSALAFILGISCARGEAYWNYLAETRYDGRAVCTAKREKYWGVERYAGFFGLTTYRALAARDEPHVLQIVLDDDMRALLHVSPYLFGRIPVGSELPPRISRAILRRSLFVGQPRLRTAID